MKRTYSTSLVLSFALSTQWVDAFPFQGNYLPKQFIAMGRAFPLKLLFKDVPDSVETKNGDVTISANAGDITLSGIDLFQRKWKVRPTAGMRGPVYAADLDGNGKTDFAICFYTGACGIAPSHHIVFVMIDKNNRPSCFDVVGFYEYGENGFDDLRTIRGHKGAVFVQQQLAYESKTSKSYWKTTAWRARDAKWDKMNELGKERLPAYIWYTFKENRHIHRPDPAATTDGERDMAPFKGESIP